MKTKVSFKVKIQKKLLDKIATVMSGLDLGITGIEASEVNNVSWFTFKKVDKEYLTMMRGKVKEGFEKQDYRVISIRRTSVHKLK